MAGGIPKPMSLKEPERLLIHKNRKEQQGNAYAPVADQARTFYGFAGNTSVYGPVHSGIVLNLNSSLAVFNLLKD